MTFFCLFLVNKKLSKPRKQKKFVEEKKSFLKKVRNNTCFLKTKKKRNFEDFQNGSKIFLDLSQVSCIIFKVLNI